MVNQKIHFIHFSMKSGGIEVLLPGIIKSLKDFNFSVFSIRPPNKNDINVYSGVDVKLTTGHDGFKAYIAAYKYARKNRNDIFQVFNIGPVFLLILRLAGVRKLIYSIHGSIYWKKPHQKIIRKFFWFLGVSNKYIITANSEYSAKMFKNKILNRPIILLYNPIDLSRFFYSHEINNFKGKQKIIYSGRLASGKNLELWVKIAHYIISKDNNYYFEIHGDGPLRKSLQEQIKELKIEEHVKLMGFTNKPENEYKNASLLLFLSEYESFGNVVVESILCGTPVICSNIPSMREIFKECPEFIVDLDTDIFENVYLKIQKMTEVKSKTLALSDNFKKKFGHKSHYKILTELYNSF